MNVATFLEQHHCWYEHVLHHPTYSAQRLAHELHVPGREVAKTVLVRTNGRGKFAVAVLPANRKIDFERVSKLVGKDKSELATESEIAQHFSDCEFGALPPFGSQYGMKTIVDSSLAEDEEIVFESNTHHEAIRMRFDEFRKLEHPLIAPIAAKE